MYLDSNPEEERKMLEKEVQNLTKQLIPLLMKYFSKLIAQAIFQKY